MALGDEINQFYLVIEGMVILCKYNLELIDIIIGKPGNSLVCVKEIHNRIFLTT